MHSARPAAPANPACHGARGLGGTAPVPLGPEGSRQHWTGAQAALRLGAGHTRVVKNPQVLSRASTALPISTT